MLVFDVLGILIICSRGGESRSEYSVRQASYVQSEALQTVAGSPLWGSWMAGRQGVTVGILRRWDGKRKEKDVLNSSGRPFELLKGL